MLKQIEGSQGVAEAVALCRPQVVCAYPITPQTHIVEGVGAMVKAGTLENCDFINVESEFAALSVAIGSSAVGARTYSKDFELEADSLGTVIAFRSGYQPLVGAQFFNRIPDPGDKFLGTHPPNSERLNTVRKTMAGL